MNHEIKKIKSELVEIGRRIAGHGLVVGPGGNTSARIGNIIYMKASGACFEDATTEQYIGVDLNTGTVVDGKLRPTCEIRMHVACYQERRDVNAVVHTHPPYAVAWAMSGRTLRRFTPDFVALVVTDVPVVKYVRPAGQELAEQVRKQIKSGYNAVFLSNHGLLVVGTNLKEAFYRSLLIESAAKTALIAELNGTMKYFTPKQAETVNQLEVESYRRKILKKQQSATTDCYSKTV